MMGNRKAILWAISILGLCGILVAAILVVRKYRNAKPIAIIGAVIKQDKDPLKQYPIANVEVKSPDGLLARNGKSDFSGAFKLSFIPSVKMGQAVRLSFRHPDFQDLDLIAVLSEKLEVFPMIPLHSEVEPKADVALGVVGNVLVRYSIETTKTENIGSAVKTFQIVNQGNVPCVQGLPCSPNGKWKAAIGSASLDAGEGNVFRDARVTCIAGPCPFTRIDLDEFSPGGRVIKVTARGWSDTTTFLLQSEVFRTQLDSIVRTSYPVIFGRALNFTLPSSAEGPSILAELDGTLIVFPLGPSPKLSWADCQVRVEKNNAKDYRCELKDGYRFR